MIINKRYGINFKLIFIAVLSFFIFTTYMFSQSYETHKYETLFSDDEFEIRLYEPVLKAKTYSTKVQIIILENYLVCIWLQ